MKEKFDTENWNRRDAYLYFRDYINPFASATFNVDITALWDYSRKRGYSINLANTYVAARLCNEIMNFRLRIEDRQVVLYDVTHPGQTVGYPDGSYTNCFMEYKPTLAQFDRDEKDHLAVHKEKRANEVRCLENDVIFFTTVPWFSFTGLKVPNKDNAQSNPKVSFGKITLTSDGRRLLPANMEIHHALMDGYHMGLFINGFENYAANPHLLDK